MIGLKSFLLIGILSITMLIGITQSKKFNHRVNQLIEMQRALNIFEEKIKFTYEPIPDVFMEISKICTDDIADIFKTAVQKMKVMTAGEAWEIALEQSNTKFTKDDLEILKGLAKMLGRTDLDGQVSEIRLTKKFIDTKIEEAENIRNKNSKLYKTLGWTSGLAIVIILI